MTEFNLTAHIARAERRSARFPARRKAFFRFLTTLRRRAFTR
ncbi:hypothetical protein [Acidiphilium sp.]|nr:hypothetical protein [Acidiphilium sp.]